jgi:hypothetical protein
MAYGRYLRAVAAGLGALLLTGVAGAAFADDPAVEAEGVDVRLDVQALQGGGALSISVADDTVVLVEDVANADPGQRWFAADLPAVTVRDTRDPADVPAGVGWYVLGQATDFAAATSGQPAIPVDQLGWTPFLIDGDYDDDGQDEVGEGDPVGSALDSPPGTNSAGLVGQEQFAYAAGYDSAAAGPGEWSASARLLLKTLKTVAPGAYTSTLTLSLFED